MNKLASKILGLLLVAMTFFLIDNNIQAQSSTTSNVVNFFEDYSGEDDFTTVYISSKMFELIAKLDVEDSDEAEALSVVQDLKGIRILVYSPGGDEDDEGETIKPKSLWKYNPQTLYQKINKKIPSNFYEELMIVKSEDSNVRFLVKEGVSGVIEELLMVVGTEDTFVFMSLVGNIDLNKISSIADKVDVDGLEYLDQIEEN